MIGTTGHFFIYDDSTFNCPDCRLVHFEKDWRPFWDQDKKKFIVKCVNRACRHKLVVIANKNIIHVTTLRLHRIVNKQTKIKKPIVMRDINVETQLKRYVDVNTAHKQALVRGLNQLIEDDRLAMIEQAKKTIEALEKGEIPEKPQARKKKQSVAESDPTILDEQEVTNDEAPLSDEL